MYKLLIAAFAVIAFTFVNPQLAASKATQINQTIDFSLTNTCCGEDVHITGDLHIVIIKNNGTDFQLHENGSNMTGTGSSGSTYHGNLTVSEKINFSDGSFDVVEHFTMTSSNGCKFKLTYKVHLVIDAKGNVRVDSFTYTTECF